MVSRGGFMFNMSVGCDSAGITYAKIDSFAEFMKNASKTRVRSDSMTRFEANLSKFKNVSKSFLDNISPRVCGPMTLSALYKN